MKSRACPMLVGMVTWPGERQSGREEREGPLSQEKSLSASSLLSLSCRLQRIITALCVAAEEKDSANKRLLQPPLLPGVVTWAHSSSRISTNIDLFIYSLLIHSSIFYCCCFPGLTGAAASPSCLRRRWLHPGQLKAGKRQTSIHVNHPYVLEV